jgi:hypothetical protein
MKMPEPEIQQLGCTRVDNWSTAQYGCGQRLATLSWGVSCHSFQAEKGRGWLSTDSAQIRRAGGTGTEGVRSEYVAHSLCTTAYMVPEPSQLHLPAARTTSPKSNHCRSPLRNWISGNQNSRSATYRECWPHLADIGNQVKSQLIGR